MRDEYVYPLPNQVAYDFGDSVSLPQPGLTKRELFAGMAMQGLLAADSDQGLSLDLAAKFAVGHADALLEQLEATKP